MITGLGTIWCQTSNMEASLAFYRDLLGLEPVYTSDHWTEFDLGNGRLALHSRLDDGIDPLGVYLRGWTVGVTTGDIRALRERLLAAGATIHSGYHETPGGVVMDFADPDGNVLQAMQVGLTIAALGES